DAADNAVHDAARTRTVRAIERAEAQRVQQRDRTRAHREDVADDAADARGRPLIRLDEGWMVVRLDFEDRRQAVADRDCARVLAGTLQHSRALRRQLLEVDPGALVAAVLRPHDREDAQLRNRGFAVERRDDAVVLLARQSVAFQDFPVDLHLYDRAFLRQRANDGLEDDEAVGAAERGLARALGVRHHADHVTLLIADARDVVDRAVGIRTRRDVAVRLAISEYDAA